MSTDAVGDALRHLATEASVTREEWRTQRRGDEAMLDALVSHRYVREQGGRFTLTRDGFARIEE